MTDKRHLGAEGGRCSAAVEIYHLLIPTRPSHHPSEHRTDRQTDAQKHVLCHVPRGPHMGQTFHFDVKLHSRADSRTTAILRYAQSAQSCIDTSGVGSFRRFVDWVGQVCTRAPMSAIKSSQNRYRYPCCSISSRLTEYRTKSPTSLGGQSASSALRNQALFPPYSESKSWAARRRKIQGCNSIDI